ncbi:MAG: hypothetical protein V1746_01080 [bacterium]
MKIFLILFFAAVSLAAAQDIMTQGIAPALPSPSSSSSAKEPSVQPRMAASLILPRNPINKAPPAKVETQIGTFFDALKQDKVDTAFQDLLKDSEEIQRKYDTDEFVQKTKRAIGAYGNVQGYELYDNRAVGSRLMILTYFVYLQSTPLRWRFIYYNANNTAWKIINLSVDDLLSESILIE